jgi:hypothetical protein
VGKSGIAVDKDSVFSEYFAKGCTMDLLMRLALSALLVVLATSLSNLIFTRNYRGHRRYGWAGVAFSIVTAGLDVTFWPYGPLTPLVVVVCALLLAVSYGVIRTVRPAGEAAASVARPDRNCEASPSPTEAPARSSVP